MRQAQQQAAKQAEEQRLAAQRAEAAKQQAAIEAQRQAEAKRAAEQAAAEQAAARAKLERSRQRGQFVNEVSGSILEHILNDLKTTQALNIRQTLFAASIDRKNLLSRVFQKMRRRAQGLLDRKSREAELEQAKTMLKSQRAPRVRKPLGNSSEVSALHILRASRSHFKQSQSPINATDSSLIGAVPSLLAAATPRKRPFNFQDLPSLKCKKRNIPPTVPPALLQPRRVPAVPKAISSLRELASSVIDSALK